MGADGQVDTLGAIGVWAMTDRLDLAAATRFVRRIRSSGTRPSG